MIELQRKLRYSLYSVFGAALLVGCGTADATDRGAGDNTAVTIAVAWPWHARQELRYAEGLQLAVDEINAAGGVKNRPIRLRREDDSASVNQGRLLAERLVRDKSVVAVIGHLQSYVTIPAAAIYEMAGVVLLAPAATDVELTKRGYTHVFRATFVDPDIGAQMADYARTRGYRRVAILYVRTDYGRALANAFDERAADKGMTVAVRQSYDPNEHVQDGFATLMGGWGRLELDAIFLAGEVPLAGRLIAGIRAAGLTIPILGGDAMSSPALIESGGKATEGTVVAAIFHPDVPTPEVSRFVQAFRQHYGMDPDPSSALGYDAVHVLADAMKRARSFSGADIAAALHATSDLRGVTGRFKFAPSGDLIGRKIVRLVVRNGQFQYLPDETL